MASLTLQAQMRETGAPGRFPGLIASGAEFRERFSVDDCLLDGTAVTGIRGRSYDSGAHMSEYALHVVGAADGAKMAVEHQPVKAGDHTFDWVFDILR
jgi:hypothetical protein